LAVLAPFPTFLIVGMRHNATRWLRFNLDAHPEVFAPPIHPWFFTDPERMSRLGLRWYRDQFLDWDGEPFHGECSPSYADWNHNPREIAIRISKTIPDVRLVAIVGNPVDRVHAELRRLVRWGEVPPDVDPATFYSMVDQSEPALRALCTGLQSSGLWAYRNLFGEQLKLVVLDDILADPAAVYASVAEHIGADPTFVPEGIDQVLYRDDLVVDVAPPDTAARQQLYQWYRTDVAGLEEMLERDLSAWDPGSDQVAYSPEELFRSVFGGPDDADVTIPSEPGSS
jgi:hypothetical protein